MIYHILCITKNQFTAQPQRYKRASSIHKNRGSTKQINLCKNFQKISIKFELKIEQKFLLGKDLRQKIATRNNPLRRVSEGKTSCDKKKNILLKFQFLNQRFQPQNGKKAAKLNELIRRKKVFNGRVLHFTRFHSLFSN